MAFKRKMFTLEKTIVFPSKIDKITFWLVYRLKGVCFSLIFWVVMFVFATLNHKKKKKKNMKGWDPTVYFSADALVPQIKWSKLTKLI